MSERSDQVGPDQVPAGMMTPWDVGELPEPHRLRWSPRGMLGPGLLMAGAAIGGGEWLVGPAITSKYGGMLMWIAAISILLQACYNQEVMRYTLYSGEPILLGCFRKRPGPVFWTFAYLILDFGAIWPYLAANAAVPLTAAFLGHIPGAQVDMLGRSIPEATQLAELATKQWVSYGIFLAAFIPLIFGGKIYNALERVMTVKIIFVLGYLTFVGLFFVRAETWYAIFSGFVGSPGIHDGGFSFKFLPDLPEGETLDFALLATFAAIAGAGGLSNTAFSNYCRDKGWGMGALVGAIPSAVGGSTISLSHTGKVFRINEQNLTRWQGWMRVIKRDQWAIWVIGCILGMAIPSLVSMQFIRELGFSEMDVNADGKISLEEYQAGQAAQAEALAKKFSRFDVNEDGYLSLEEFRAGAGREVKGDELAAVTARLLTDRTGMAIFWWLTLLCGFMVLGPSQVSSMDGIIRRWTDIIWTGTPAAHKLRGNQVKYIYYGLLTLYGIFGLVVLVLMPNPLSMVKVASIIFNYALGFSAAHTLVVNCSLVPKELRPGWFMRGALGAAFVFFTTVSVIATRQFLAS